MFGYRDCSKYDCKLVIGKITVSPGETERTFTTFHLTNIKVAELDDLLSRYVPVIK